MSRSYDKTVWHQSLVLAATMEEGAGTVVNDRSRASHTLDFNGPPTWAQIAPSDVTVVEFDSTNPDWLECSAADTNIALNFIAQDFSLSAWIYPTDLTANRMIFCRGFLNADGYYWAVLINGSLAFYTNQAAAGQSTLSGAGDVVVDTWHQVVVTRDGADVVIYVNGINVNVTPGTHINPLTSARDLHIGIYDNETGSPWEGQMGSVKAWNGKVLSAAEVWSMFSTERQLFGG